MPPDDEAIQDDWLLLRRVAPDFYKGVAPDIDMASGVFDDSKNSSAMSVFVREKLAELGLDETSVTSDHPGYGLVSITARQARDEGFGIVMSPDPADGVRGQAHAQVHCKKTRARKQHLKKSCVHLAGPLAPAR